MTEVLSSSTQEFDSGEKFEDYKKIEDLEEYVLISQDQQHVEIRHRSGDNTWKTFTYTAGEQVFLSSINLKFDIAELYRGLD